MSQAICANTKHSAVIKGLTHPQVFTSQSETNSLQIPKGQLRDNCTGSQKSEPLQGHMCDTQGGAQSSYNWEQGTPRPWTGKNRTWFQTGASKCKCHGLRWRRQVWSSHRLHLGSSRPAPACVRQGLASSRELEASSPRMIPQPAADPNSADQLPRRDLLFPPPAWSLLHNQVGAQHRHNSVKFHEFQKRSPHNYPQKQTLIQWAWCWITTWWAMWCFPIVLKLHLKQSGQDNGCWLTALFPVPRQLGNSGFLWLPL